MNKSPTRFFKIVLSVVIVVSALLFFWGLTPGHALPEYAMRTGEPCATCHVSPGGGGPRTLRGLLWASRGKPEKVPDLPNILIAPALSNGDELYEFGCSACHGKNGEGLLGVTLTDSGIPADKIRAQVLSGSALSGMPSFQGKFTDTQLTALVNYVAGLANGSITPAPNSYPLEQGHLTCSSNCGGN
jgi:mono/diheme cytochrome c family protein